MRPIPTSFNVNHLQVAPPLRQGDLSQVGSLRPGPSIPSASYAGVVGGFDVTFKGLTDRAPKTALRRFGYRPLPEGAEFRAIERELALPVRAVDQAFSIRTAHDEWVEHFEAEVGLSEVDKLATLRRAALIWVVKLEPVFTTIVLMSRRAGPASPPSTIGGDYGTFTGVIRPRYVTLWKIPAAAFLEDGSIHAIPWVGGAEASPAELEEAVRRIRAVPDPELRRTLAAELLTLGGLQYTRDEIAAIREMLDMATSKDIMRASVIGEELIEQGREEGREVGREEARLETLREHVILLIESRAPGHPAARKVLSISDPVLLDSLFHRLLLAEPGASAELLDRL